MSQDQIPKTVGDLTLSQMEDLIERSVSKTLIKIGIDLSDPLELQADSRFVRRVRKNQEKLSAKALVTAVGMAVTFGGSLIVVGFVAWITKKGSA